LIRFFDYRREYAALRAEIDAAMRRVLDSGRLILGPEVEAFEQEWAAFCGSRHAVGVNSGTDALILALRATGIGQDDGVLTVANAGAPPVAAIRAVGARPQFLDVDPDTLLLDTARLANADPGGCKAIVVVHLYGQPASMEPILDYARRHDMAVIEDCAQAHGATLAGRHVGSFGDVGCFSFYPTKNIGAYGDGGMVVTNNDAVATRVREQRMYGFRGDRHAHVEGLNSRLDELQAAILRVKLAAYPAMLEERRRRAARYRELLAETPVETLAVRPGAGHAFHLLVVRSPDRAQTIARLRGRGVGFGIHYPDPCHRMEAYRFLGYDEGSLPVTERACGEVLSLPLYAGIDEESIDGAVAALAGR
jgi:dTDP-4-amino-4,6-dideoxygalactose transaminase